MAPRKDTKAAATENKKPAPMTLLDAFAAPVEEEAPETRDAPAVTEAIASTSSASLATTEEDKAASRKTASDATASGSLLESSENACRKKRRRLQPQTTNEVVARKLYDNFKGADADTTDCRRIGGMTLRERIKTDIYKCREDNTFKMGSGYYRDLKAKYQMSGAVADALSVSDMGAPICPKLMASIAAYQSSQKNSQPLQSWLEVASGANQKELVGLLRLALRLEPSLSLKQAQVVSSIGKFIVRCGLDKKFPAEFAAFRSHLDAGVCMLYAHAKKEQISLGVFISLHRDLCCVLAGAKDLEAVLGVSSTGSWADVADELMRITGGSNFGMKALGLARILVQSATLGRVLDEEIGQLGVSDISSERVQALRIRMQNAIDELDIGGLLRSQKRTIELAYCGIPLSIAVQDPAEEVRLRIGCIIKTNAVGHGLPYLIGEQAFAERPSPVVQVCPSLYKDMDAARKLINGIVENSEVQSGEFLRELVNKKSTVALSLDPTFKLEVATVAWISGAGGVATAHRRVLAVLPNKNRAVSLTAAATLMQSLRSSEMSKCACRSVQTELQLTSEVLQRLISGQPAKDSQLHHSDFMRSVGEQLSWFAEFQPEQGEKPRGRGAIQARYDMVAKTGSEHRNLNMLAGLHTFKRILTDEQVSELASWTNEVLTKFKVADGEEGTMVAMPTTTTTTSEVPGSSVVDLFA